MKKIKNIELTGTNNPSIAWIDYSVNEESGSSTDNKIVIHFKGKLEDLIKVILEKQLEYAEDKPFELLIDDELFTKLLNNYIDYIEHSFPEDSNGNTYNICLVADEGRIVASKACTASRITSEPIYNPYNGTVVQSGFILNTMYGEGFDNIEEENLVKGAFLREITDLITENLDILGDGSYFDLIELI